MFPLRATAYSWPPYVENCIADWPNNCTHPGIEITLFLSVLQSAGFQISIPVVAKDEDEARDLLLNNTVDISAVTFPLLLQADFDDILDSTVTVMDDLPAFIMLPKPQFKLSSDLLLGLFSPWVWLSITLTACLVFGVKWLGQANPKRWVSMHVTQALCMLFELLLIVPLGIYATMLAIALSRNVSVHSMPFTNVEELLSLLHTKQCKLVTFAGVKDDLEEVFPSRKPRCCSYNYRFFAANKINPPYTIAAAPQSTHELLSRISLQAQAAEKEASCLVGVDYATRIPFYMNSEPSVRYVVENKLRKYPYAFFYRRSLPEGVKERIKVAFMAGVPNEHYNRVATQYAWRQQPVEHLVAANHEETKTRPLSLDQMNDTFVLGLYGYAIAFAIGLMEKVSGVGVCWFVTRRRRKVTPLT